MFNSGQPLVSGSQTRAVIIIKKESEDGHTPEVPSTLVYKAQGRAWSLEEVWEATGMEAFCRFTHAWPSMVSCSQASKWQVTGLYVPRESLQSRVPATLYPTSFVRERTTSLPARDGRGQTQPPPTWVLPEPSYANYWSGLRV